MKKVLFATTALVLSAGYAAADVSISGYGRFGLQYNDAAVSPATETTMETRMRMNIDVSKETDAGVTFGGRVRLQYDNGGSMTAPNAALMYLTYGGFRMEVGNVNQAMDSAALVYGSELGLVSSSFGDIQTPFYAYVTGPYAEDDAGNTQRMGVSVSYSMAGFTGMLSYIDPDQTSSADPLFSGVAAKEETSLALSYASGPLTVTAAGTWNAAGVDGSDIAFVGVGYAVNDAINVGLNYTDEADGETIVGYGSYKMGATTLRAYVANNSAVGNATDTAYGIGADYDLGGATLLGGIQKGYAKQTVADFGVKFSF